MTPSFAYLLPTLPQPLLIAMVLNTALMALVPKTASSPWIRRYAQVVLLLTFFWFLHEYLLSHPID